MISVRLSIDEQGHSVEPDGEEQIRAMLGREGALTWLDVDRDDLDQLEPFRDLIHLHPLALEDAASPHQRPILNRYGDTFFLVLYELVFGDDSENGEKIRSYPISFFVGRNYIITSRDIERSTLDDVADRWHTVRQYVDTLDTGFLLYTLIDAIVDNYFPAIDALGDRLEALEDAAEAGERHIQPRIHEVRRQLFELRRVLAPGREVLNDLVRRETPLVSEETMNYFHDVYDHILRVLDWVDAYREMAGTLFEMQLAMASHRLDQVIRTLTVWSIILMVVTLIAGIYGMNFRHMPELEWLFGYPFAILLMLLCTAALLLFFRKREWI
jgi:magnesium transporter